VRPLFTRLGVGRCLVERAESGARNAGFTEFSLRASVNSVGFFQSLGFEIKSHGVRNIDAEQGLPVRFMRKSIISNDVQSKSGQSTANSSTARAAPATTQVL